MRNAFAKEIEAAAAEDERVVLLAGDIGNRLFDSFKAKFPERFCNCGVAEANMMGVAAGMALSGLRPGVYSIVPFVTTRCLEHVFFRWFGEPGDIFEHSTGEEFYILRHIADKAPAIIRMPCMQITIAKPCNTMCRLPCTCQCL